MWKRGKILIPSRHGRFTRDNSILNYCHVHVWANIVDRISRSIIIATLLLFIFYLYCIRSVPRLRDIYRVFIFLDDSRIIGFFLVFFPVVFDEKDSRLTDISSGLRVGCTGMFLPYKYIHTYSIGI